MATEQSLLDSLGISDPQVQNQIINGQLRLLILDASAHLDWDWLLPYPVLVTGGSNKRCAWYFRGPGISAPGDPGVGSVNQILEQATNMAIGNRSYRYSVCETGFLRGFAETDPVNFKKFANQWLYNNNLLIAGGGITSPDNLLVHGETFIRNYLVGHTWLASALGSLPIIKTCWIPDDFGHDPELPVVLQAMGLIAAGFERVPGAHSSWNNPVSGAQNLATVLTNNKIDFTWTASDGSSIIAHWLIGGYGQGNDIATTNDITSYLTTNAGPSPTPYIYVPVMSDFALPNPNLLTVVNAYNNLPGNTLAVCGSFEYYAQLLQFHSNQLNASYGAEFNPNPVFTGCYGSRPELKILHQRATRNLLAAETFSILAGITQPGGGTGTLGAGSSWADSLNEAWNLLAPSTHHDYITGTAIPDVYHTEQITLSQQADKRAAWLLEEAMQTIAGAINADITTNPIVVFNSLGFGRTEIAELDAAAVANASINITGPGCQTTADGGLLFTATVPSLGYQTVVAGNAVAPTIPVTVSPSTNPVTGQSVILKNGLLTATLSQNASGVWGLTSVIDSSSGYELIKPGSIANNLLFYADGGTEYKFGMELEGDVGWQLTAVDSSIKSNSIEIIESGSLRVVVRTKMNYNDGKSNINYIFDYTLYAGEPMLRMKATGAAPMLSSPNGVTGCSVLLSFPLNTNNIDSLVRGTPYHWTDKMSIYWNQQTFLPTHNFVIPMSDNELLCAIYHSDIPGWGLNNTWNNNSFTNDATLYGCAWRNGDGSYYDWIDQGEPVTPLANGTDPAIHVHEYALRVPYGLQPAATGQPLRESLAMTSPLKALPVAIWTGALPQQASLASSSNAAAIITTAKAGSMNANDLVFRLYQPTNQALTTILNISPMLVGGGFTNVRGQTALEQDLPADQQAQLNLSVSGNGVTFTMNNALLTVAMGV